MPSSIAGIVRIAIRDYVNLNNTELINQFNGPVLMVRRTEDEIIAELVLNIDFQTKQRHFLNHFVFFF